MGRTGRKVGLAVVVAALSFALVGCHNGLGGKSAGQKVALWNGKDFTGWTRFVPDAGVKVDDVWRVRDGVLYCAGKPNGYLRTDKKYENYRLHVEWRWPETPANSGVLLHASGPDRVWPPCIECQLKSGSAGDLVLMNGTGITVDSVAHQDPARQFVGIKKKNPASENPAGQWNNYDIECQGGSVRCLVNGVLQNEGTNGTVTSGWICLQSEGGPIEFRNIYLQQN
jgi:hypothetical protein